MERRHQQHRRQTRSRVRCFRLGRSQVAAGRHDGLRSPERHRALKAEISCCQGPWRGQEVVEPAPLACADWSNMRRLLAPIGDISPDGQERDYHACQETVPTPGCPLNSPSGAPLPRPSVDGWTRPSHPPTTPRWFPSPARLGRAHARDAPLGGGLLPTHWHSDVLRCVPLDLSACRVGVAGHSVHSGIIPVASWPRALPCRSAMRLNMRPPP